MTTRRDFLRSACGLCALIGTAGMAAVLLDSCSSIPVIKASPENDRLSVPLSAFGDKPYLLVRRPGMLPDILLVKKTDGTFTALLMECSHEAQPLSVGGNSINCAAHGSKFDLDGNVTHSPATQPLKKYTAAIEGESVFILLSNSK